jgi:putative DNA primase/helicase
MSDDKKEQPKKMDKWQCQKCGDEFELPQGKFPLICENPACEKGRVFLALTGKFADLTYNAIQGITDKLVTDVIMKDHLFYCDIGDKNLTLYVWQKNHWCNDVTEGTILNELSGIFKESQSRQKMNFDKILKFIKGQAMNTKVVPKPPHLILFKNGYLDINTGAFEKPTPEIFCVNMLPYDYAPRAKCPKWLKFIDDILRKEDHAFLQEWMGYALYTAVPEPAFLIGLGVGNNSKSTWVLIFMGLVGRKNFVTTNLADLTYDDYAPADLYQKLAVISDDIGPAAIANTGTLKEAASGSTMNVHHKFGHRFDMTPYTKLTYTCNDAPEIKDTSDAMKRRLKVLEFPYVFAKSPMPGEKLARNQQEIEAELLEELPGIANWAIEGLKRLIKNNFKFSISRSTKETWLYYRRRSNPAEMFWDECIESTDDDLDWLSREEVFKAYKIWEEDTKIKVKLNRDRFFKALKQLDIEATRSREHDMKRVYLGVKIECSSVPGLAYSGIDRGRADWGGGDKKRVELRNKDKAQQTVEDLGTLEQGKTSKKREGS